jgi:hypothetical protein
MIFGFMIAQFPLQKYRHCLTYNPIKYQSQNCGSRFAFAKRLYRLIGRSNRRIILRHDIWRFK